MKFGNKFAVKVLIILSLIISGCSSLEKQNKETETQGPNPSPSALPSIAQISWINLELLWQWFTSPIAISQTKEDKRIFIADQIGLIKIINASGQLLNEPFLDIRDKLVKLNKSYDERWLLWFEFHPYFKDNWQFYVYYSGPLRNWAPKWYSHTNYIVEYKVDPNNPNKALKSSWKIILSIDNPYSNHNWWNIKFWPDDYLYIAVWDWWNKNDIWIWHSNIWNWQDTSSLLWSILRIDVNNDDPYNIPMDNPFSWSKLGKEIYAYWFRNPFRFSFDRWWNNQLIVGDVWQWRWEEIDIVEKWGNYWWNIKEWNHCFDPQNENRDFYTCPSTWSNWSTLIDPVIEYKNSNQEWWLWMSVIWWYIYRGNNIPALQWKYIFWDWSSSFTSPSWTIFIWDPYETPNFKELYKLNNEYLLSFWEDNNWELYILTTKNAWPSGNTGKVYKIVK